MHFKCWTRVEKRHIFKIHEMYNEILISTKNAMENNLQDVCFLCSANRIANIWAGTHIGPHAFVNVVLILWMLRDVVISHIVGWKRCVTNGKILLFHEANKHTDGQTNKANKLRYKCIFKKRNTHTEKYKSHTNWMRMFRFFFMRICFHEDVCQQCYVCKLYPCQK